MRAAALLALIALALALGCARLPSRPEREPPAAAVARERALAASADFALRGRIAASRRGRGGSGHFQWRESGERLDLLLRAPGLAGAVRLRAEGGSACLEGRAEGTRCGRDPERLLAEVLEARIPLRALSWWLRGSRAPGARSSGRWDPRGLPVEIRQDGWTIHYLAWHEDVSPPMPRSIEAQRAGVRVRIVVTRWERP